MPLARGGHASDVTIPLDQQSVAPCELPLAVRPFAGIGIADFDGSEYAARTAKKHGSVVLDVHFEPRQREKRGRPEALINEVEGLLGQGSVRFA